MGTSTRDGATGHRKLWGSLTVLAFAIALGALVLFVQGNGRADVGAYTRTGPPSWGIYQIFWGAQRFEGVLAATLETLASPPDYVMFYRDLGRGFPFGGCQVIRSHGATPVLSLELWHWGSRGSRGQHDYLQMICDGAYDDFFRQWAVDAKSFEDSVVVRFGFEMNGNWFTWGNRPEEFIHAWRRAHAIFEEAGADNVVWAWCPNNVSIPRDPANTIERYYPGDDVVDWIGLDGYNFGDHHDEWHRWETFDEVFGPALALCDSRWPHKPIFLAEFGSAPGEPGQKAAWIRDAHARIQSHPRLFGAIWYNLDKRSEGEPDWSLDSDPGSLEAFNQTFAQPRGR